MLPKMLRGGRAEVTDSKFRGAPSFVPNFRFDRLQRLPVRFRVRVGREVVGLHRFASFTEIKRAPAVFVCPPGLREISSLITQSQRDRRAFALAQTSATPWWPAWPCWLR